MKTLLSIVITLGLGGMALGAVIKTYNSQVLKNLYPFGYKIGKFISTGMRKSLGVPKAEKLETEVLEATIDEFTKGLKAGMDYDDSQKVEG
jgi:hypothetical protein